jgi:hypothetical protein
MYIFYRSYIRAFHVCLTIICIYCIGFFKLLNKCRGSLSYDSTVRCLIHGAYFVTDITSALISGYFRCDTADHLTLLAVNLYITILSVSQTL